ncbi:MAG TPA: methyltransferase domain-containing protein [Pyrinomonadaceae bacterium]|nr:methyltransferase domain-containing protein [Pyrinomonadaceae bacterium]
MKLLEVLACPKCYGQLSCVQADVSADGEVNTGSLDCTGCSQSYPIEAGIPRFVEKDNYAVSFGYQWNLFKLEQLDSVNGTNLSEQRLSSETGWTKDWMKGKWILDAGCGAGRFLDVASKSEAEVVGLDISSAIDAAKANLAGRENVHFVQASIFEPPFRTGAFDGCYCIGVVQHTPDPQKAMRALPRVLRTGGLIAITAYERKPWTRLYSKYLIRSITKRMDEKRLLARIKGLMPVLFPVTNVLFRLPLAGRLFMFLIPVANYVHERTLSRQQRYEWAVLDTFDMLSPRYDQPRTAREVEEALSAEGVVELKRLPTSGVNIVGRKRA